MKLIVYMPALLVMGFAMYHFYLAVHASLGVGMALGVLFATVSILMFCYERSNLRMQPRA